MQQYGSLRGMENGMYRIIIVEDEVIARKGLSCCVDWEGMGFEVAGVFEDGLDAYEWLRTNTCDVILTDIMMEQMSGLELARNVSAEKPGIKIVILNGYKEFDYAKEALAYGCKEYLVKPIDEEMLARVLCKLKEELDKENGAQENDEGLISGYRQFVMDIEARKKEEIEERLYGYMKRIAYLPVDELRAILTKFCSRIARDYKERKRDPWDITEGKFNILLLREQEDYQALCRCVLDMLLALVDGLEKQEKAQQEYAVERIKNYIQNHISEECNTFELAQKYNMSTSYLCRMFKKKTGETLSDYILRMRMEKASELLKEGKYSISEVGTMVGYNYLGYFSTVFKKYVGYSPTEYRDMYAKN